MALTSTLFTGLSGLNVNQARLNVVGNNIANVNTVAFKSSRVLFKSQFYITDIPGGPPDGDFGGQNPSQRGLGAAVSAIERNLNPGNIETTGRSTDMAIEGEGYFIVQGKEQSYTRDGSFTLNAENDLTTTSGAYLQGFGVDANEAIIPGQLGNLRIPLGALTKAKATSSVTMQGNFNADGVVGSGASILNSQAFTTAGSTQPALATLLTDLRNPNDLATPLFQAGSTLTLAGKRGGRDLPELNWQIDPGSTLADLANFFNQGMQIDTDRTTNPPPGATLQSLPGDDPTTTRLTLVGNYGAENALTLGGTGFVNSATTPGLSIAQGSYFDGVNTIESGAVGESVFTSFVVYDSLGTALNVNITAVLESKDDQGTNWRWFATSADDTDGSTFDPTSPTHPGTRLGSGTISFNTAGGLRAASDTSLDLSRAATGAVDPLRFELDFSRLSALTSRQSDLIVLRQDGAGIGTLANFSVASNGQIIGTFDNGLTGLLGQVAMATFKNPQGLIDRGGGYYSPSTNAGLPVVGTPLQFGAGALRGAALELSNVDLSQEFINMIVSSTGFSAASRVITTADRLLTELLNASR